MGWITNKIRNRSEQSQLIEITYFIDGLSAMDGREVGMVLAVATDRRHRLQRTYGWNLLDPIVLMAANPDVAAKVASLTKEMQSRNATPVAALLMVWLHTLRSTNTPALRGRGRALWAQLQRGFEHVDDASLGWTRMSGELLDTSDFSQFPEGLLPTPR